MWCVMKKTIVLTTDEMITLFSAVLINDEILDIGLNKENTMELVKIQEKLLEITHKFTK